VSVANAVSHVAKQRDDHRAKFADEQHVNVVLFLDFSLEVDSLESNVLVDDDRECLMFDNLSVDFDGEEDGSVFVEL